MECLGGGGMVLPRAPGCQICSIIPYKPQFSKNQRKQQFADPINNQMTAA